MTTDPQPRDGFFAQLGQVHAAPPWTWGEVLLVLLVLAVSLLVIASSVAVLVSPETTVPTPPTPTAFLIGWTVGLVITALFVLIRFRRSQDMFDALRIVGETAQSRRPIPLLMMVGVAAALVANVIAGLGSGRDFQTMAPLQHLAAPQNLAIGQIILAGVFAIVVQPIAEGLVFFGVIQPRLRSSLGAWPGLLTTVLLYAGTHYLVYGARPGVVNSPLWYGFVLPLITGFMFGAVRVWMRSTRAAIATAMGAGMVALLVMLAVG